MKRKPKRILVVVVKRRHRANGLFVVWRRSMDAGTVQALPFQSLLTKLVFQWLQGGLPNNVLHVQNFLLCLFSRFCCGCVELGSSATMLNNSWYAMISPEKPISVGTHTQAQPLCQIERNFWQILSFKLDGLFKTSINLDRLKQLKENRCGNLPTKSTAS